MPAVRVNPLTRLIWRVHRGLFRLSGGRVGSRLAGHDVLFVTTTGRRSGEARTVGLNHLEVDGGYAVVGSFAGEDRDPGWAHNLRADPDVVIQVGRARSPARARELQGTEREGVLARFIDKDDAYAVYRDRTTRVIPVFLLEPRG